MRLNLGFAFFLMLFVSCKKETVQPDPIPGKVIVKKSPAIYSGYINAELSVNHQPGNIDTSLSSFIYLYDVSGINPAATVSLNGYTFSFGNSMYDLFLDQSGISNPFLVEYRSLTYSGLIDGIGNFSITDNRPYGTFSNHNTVPLNFSKANGYTLLLNNISDCNIIEVRMGGNQAYRNVSVQSPSFRFYDSELLNTAVGSQTQMEIKLISKKDTTINNKRFIIEKTISHKYMLKFTN